MTKKIVGMLAETFIHPGIGQNVGAIDLPVAREAATDYPFIPGSSLKGALLNSYKQTEWKDNAEEIFGRPDNTGGLLVSDARLLLLPVRSLSSAYKWVTCPHLLERFKRDTRRSGGDPSFNLPQVQDKEALSQGNGRLFLEERSFKVTDAPGEDIVQSLERLIPDEGVRGRLAGQLTILSNNDFKWFALYSLAVQARNVLEDETKASKNLWYEETLPPDTLMYTFLSERYERYENGNGPLEYVREIGDYLQVGGNETVGQGWFSLGWGVGE